MVGHTDAVPDPPSWLRSVVSLVFFVGLGACALAGAAWLAVQVLPDAAEEAADDADLFPEDYDATPPAELVETGLAAPGDAMTQVDDCAVVDDVIEASGRVQNTTTGPQAFLLQLAVLVDDRLYDGTTIEVAVPTVPPGQEQAWSVTVGAIDPDAPPEAPPDCRIDRVALARELAD